MAYPTYQTAGSQSTLYDLFQQSRFGEQKSNIALGSQKGKLTEEFEKQLEDAQKAAQRKAGKNKGFFKGLNILGSFLGPLGAGLTKGISAGMQGNQQRKGLEQLLSGVDSDRWDKLFTRKASKDYKSEAEGMQMSSGDVLRGAAGAGVAGWGMSKMLGGKRNEGLGQKMFKKPEAIQGAGVTDIGMGTDMMLADPTMRMGAETLGKATPFKNLFGELKGFGQDGDGMDKMQQSMMLPMLLQQLFGGEY